MRNTGKAFLLGGSLSAFFYLAVKFGVDMGFRVAGSVLRRREDKQEKENS